MGTASGISTSRPVSSSFGALFRMAYGRIWASRALRGWEIAFWSILAVFLALNLHRYFPFIVAWRLFLYVKVAMLIVTPILLAGWIYEAHTSISVDDDSLKSLPIRGISIVLPRFTAVVVSWLRLFASLIPILLLELHKFYSFRDLHRSYPFNAEEYMYPWFVPVIMLQLVGWVVICTSWGFLSGSISGTRSRYFLVYYYLPIVIALITTFYVNNKYLFLGQLMFPITLDHIFLMAFFSDCEFWPKWMQIAGIAGFILGFQLLVMAGNRWRRS